MAKEYGMDAFNDRWDWQPKKGRQTPDKQSGAQVQPESAAQINPDLTPDFVKIRDIRIARALAETPDISHLTSEQIISTLARGLKFASEVKPSPKAREFLLIEDAYLEPLLQVEKKFNPKEFIPIVQTPTRGALLTR